MAYTNGSLGSYGGVQQNPTAGLAGYGQSLSSEQIDTNNNNNAGLSGYTGCSGAPYTPGATYASQYMGAYGSQYQQYPVASYYGYMAPYPQLYSSQSQPSGQIDTNDPQLQQQIEQIVSSLTECRRPMLRRQVITVPSSCPGKV